MAAAARCAASKPLYARVQPERMNRMSPERKVVPWLLAMASRVAVVMDTVSNGSTEMFWLSAHEA